MDDKGSLDNEIGIETGRSIPSRVSHTAGTDSNAQVLSQFISMEGDAVSSIDFGQTPNHHR